MPLCRLSGNAVRLRGYMLPVQARREGIHEFVLCPFVPEDLNERLNADEMAYIRLLPGQGLSIMTSKPIWIDGRMEVARFDSSYGTGYYQIVDAKVERLGP